MEETELYASAMVHYGELSQFDKLIEEMAELTQAILKLRRHPKEHEWSHEWVHLHEEFIDVAVVMGQVQTLLDEDLLSNFHNQKLKYLSELVSKGDKDRNKYKS